MNDKRILGTILTCVIVVLSPTDIFQKQPLSIFTLGLIGFLFMRVCRPFKDATSGFKILKNVSCMGVSVIFFFIVFLFLPVSFLIDGLYFTYGPEGTTIIPYNKMAMYAVISYPVYYFGIDYYLRCCLLNNDIKKNIMINVIISALLRSLLIYKFYLAGLPVNFITELLFVAGLSMSCDMLYILSKSLASVTFLHVAVDVFSQFILVDLNRPYTSLYFYIPTKRTTEILTVLCAFLPWITITGFLKYRKIKLLP